MLSIEQARKAVRQSTATFDDELESLLQAAIIDLKTAGVAEMQDDKLYDQALRMYLKGHFEPSDPEAPACREIFEDIKLSMKLTDRYRTGGADNA